MTCDCCKRTAYVPLPVLLAAGWKRHYAGGPRAFVSCQLCELARHHFEGKIGCTTTYVSQS
jgi:hypothetical protein